MIGKTVSHYEILEKLGGGGMGVVFKARDLKLDRFVALKFLPSHLVSVEVESDRLLRERFVQEAKASSALDHPNIGVIHEVGETAEGETFIAMAYYEGQTLLRQRMERGPLPVEEVRLVVLHGFHLLEMPMSKRRAKSAIAGDDGHDRSLSARSECGSRLPHVPSTSMASGVLTSDPSFGPWSR